MSGEAGLFEDGLTPRENEVRDVFAFEIALICDVIYFAIKRAEFITEKVHDFFFGPYVIFPLTAFGISV